MICRLLLFFVLMLLVFVQPAFAQEASGLDALAGNIKNGGVILALIMAVFGVAAAFVPDDKIPGWVRPIWNLLSSNYNKAKNDPGAQ